MRPKTCSVTVMLQEQNWAQDIYVELESLASSSGAFNYKAITAFSEDLPSN